MIDPKHVRKIYSMLSTQEMIDMMSIGSELEEARWAPDIVRFLQKHDVVISPYEYAAIIIWTRESTTPSNGRRKIRP